MGNLAATLQKKNMSSFPECENQSSKVRMWGMYENLIALRDKARQFRGAVQWLRKKSVASSNYILTRQLLPQAGNVSICSSRIRLIHLNSFLSSCFCLNTCPGTNHSLRRSLHLVAPRGPKHKLPFCCSTVS